MTSKRQLATLDSLKKGGTLDIIIFEIYPIGSMYGIFTYIWLNLMVNVGKYTIHGSESYGYMGVSKNRGGPPEWMVKIMENPIKVHDFGVITPNIWKHPYIHP